MAESSQQKPPLEEECRALLDRILASRQFQRTTRLRDFLTYIVDRQFAGAQSEMTEAVIGHRVFRRSATYNPGEDSIVRTEARSLRMRLEQYYTSEGAAEPILLTIPKGAYAPQFAWRPAPQPAAVPRRRRWVWMGSAAVAVVLVIATGAVIYSRGNPSRHAAGAAASRPAGAVRFTSSDHTLEERFEQARAQALRYVYEGDPVGNWYAGNWYRERYAFYMRDIAHESAGAAALGLTEQTRNMLRLFAASVSSKRSWCGFWGINKDGFPTPVDYRSDSDFYTCLPANFDVLRSCYEQYLWTGDEAYFDAVFSSFYDRTAVDFIDAWDLDHDGVVEGHGKSGTIHGNGSYFQKSTIEPATGADLLATQYQAFIAYAHLQEHKGAHGSLSRQVAEQFRAKAEQLRMTYNTAWWDNEHNQYFSMRLADKSYSRYYIPEARIFPLLFGLTEDGERTRVSLDSMIEGVSIDHPPISYFPEVLFRHGRNDVAYRFLLMLTEPDFPPRNQPEMQFATVGATVNGLMGIEADARAHRIGTTPHLPAKVNWGKVEHLPVLQNQIAVLHRGLTETALTNQSGPAISWKACFPAAGARLTVDGAASAAETERRENAQPVVCTTVPVAAGQTRVIRSQTTL